VLIGYVSVAFAYFGWRLVAHPGRLILGSGRDTQIFVWSFAWWPHAVATWQNPFFTNVVYAPDGVNLAWTTSVPGLAFLFAPVTLLFGPAVGYNVAALLMPAISAWTAFLLCRHLTGSVRASLFGGYLFGFSSYELGQELGHLHMTAIFLVPLIVLVTIRRIQGDLDDRAFIWRLGLLLGAQLWLSIELLFTISLALLVSLVLAIVILRERRREIVALARPVTLAYGLCALLGGPLTVYLMLGFNGDSINWPPDFNGDLLNFVVPTHLIALGGSFLGSGWVGSMVAHFPSNDAERGAYLGIPTLVIVVLWFIRGRRSATVRLQTVLLLVAAIVTLGTALTVRGESKVGLPWGFIARLPIFDNVLPARISLFCALGAAVIVASWSAQARGIRSWLLPTLAVASLVPAVWHADYVLRPERWSFFTHGTYKCIPEGENLAIFPFGFWGNSLLWQAETGFRFRLAEGYLQPNPPAANLADPFVQKLTYTTENPTVADLIGFVRRKQVDRVISVGIYAHPNATQLHRLGILQADNAGIYWVPGCGYPSLRAGIHPTDPHTNERIG